MSKKGRDIYKGINSQSWASMSLFLQYVRRPDFSFIGLEGDKLEDFYLVFNDGRKIICEAKDWKRKINYSEIRQIISKAIKNNQINPSDNLLIVCTNIDKNLKGEIENYKFYEKELKEKFIKDKSFTDREVEILRQVKIWKVTQSINRKVVEVLLAEILNIWVPDYRLKEIMSDLIIQEIYFGSEKGKILSKKNFFNKMRDKEKNIVEESGYYKEKKGSEKEIAKIIKEVNNPSSKAWAISPITSLSSRPELQRFVLDRFEKKGSKVDLDKWDVLWKSSARGIFSTSVFKIFKNNLENKGNRSYLVESLPKLLKRFPGFYGQQFLVADIVDTCKRIIQIEKSYNKDIFSIIRQINSAQNRKYFYVVSSREQREAWEREEVSKLLETLYEKVEKKDFKEEIIDYVTKTFSLVKDDGDYWSYTPPSIFNILKEHVSVDFESSILWLKNIISDHYKIFYNELSNGLKYKGWDHFGLGLMGWGSKVNIKDKFFIRKILIPTLKEYYDKNKEEAWTFIVENLITRKESEISIDKPDFLNRAAIDILLEEYVSGKNNSEALNILTDFIRMRKGIPDKTNIIFNKIRDLNLSNNKKWRLVKNQVEIKRFQKLPANIFVKQIVADLASRGLKEAVDLIELWGENPKFNQIQWIGDFEIVDFVPSLLFNDDTINLAVRILKQYLYNDKFIKKIDEFKVHQIAMIAADLIVKDSEKGINLLKEIYESKDLSCNQQKFLCISISNLPKDKTAILLKVYRKFLRPVLEGLGNIGKIEERFSDRFSRASLVEFSEILAKSDRFKEALWILHFFIKDSDPPLDGSNYSDDPMGIFNYHERIKNGEDVLDIATVRGKCAWVLQKFCNIKGRKFIKEIIPLIHSLAKDPNFYVRLQAIIPLIELSKLRHKVMTKNGTERFISLKTAKDVEEIAFNMLENKKNQTLMSVMRRLAMVFSCIHSISTEEANKVIKTFLDSGFDPVIERIINLLISFAEFREESFKEKKFERLFGKKKWEKIKKFNSKIFKDILKELIINGSKETKIILARAFKQLPIENIITFEKAFHISFDYISLLTNSYDVQVFHHIYDFIYDYINKEFNMCYELWTKCIKKERAYIEDNKNGHDLRDMMWWPFHKNSDILNKIYEKKGKAEFLKWIEYLADYPEGIDVSIRDAVIRLSDFENDKRIVKRIYKKLLQKRSLTYIDLKPDWLKL